MKKIYLFVLPLLFVLQGADAQVLQLKPEQVRGLGIATESVDDGLNGMFKRLPARVEVPAGQIQSVVTTLDGVLEAVLVAPGMPVRKGQTVARIVAPQSLDLQLAHAEASARAAQARAALKRDAQLYAEGIIPQSRLELTRTAAQEAAARLTSSERALTLSGATPGRMEAVLGLKSRIDGIVLEQTVAAGEHVTAGSAVARIGRLAPLWLEIQVPQQIAAQTKLGDKVSAPAFGASGKIIAVGRALDAATQNVMLRAEIVEGAARLSPGQLVEADLQSSSAAGHAVPARALARDGDKTFVFIAGGDAKAPSFEARPVKLVGQAGDTFFVDGVKRGERIAVQGVAGLKAMLVGGGE
ncbi:MAG: efflux RND transporter periplasmic adaptor subunit [Betaproteobacteria bacterium]|nr:efflux RND transporter periplasmic adaptor subunit [Betaproteobacteria bacterium]